MTNYISKLEEQSDYSTCMSSVGHRKAVPLRFDPRSRALWRLLAFSLSSKVRGYWALALSALFLSSAVNITFPSIIGKAVDYAVGFDYANPSNLFHIKNTTLLILCFFGIGAVAGWGRVFFFQITSFHIQSSLRKRLFCNILCKDIVSFEKYKVGEFTSTILQDVETASSCFTDNLASFLRSLNSSVGGTVMLMLLSRRLTTITLSIVPFAGFCAMLYSKFARRLRTSMNSKMNDVMSIATEKFINFKTVKMFGNEKREGDMLACKLDALSNSAMSVAMADGCFMGGLGFAINVSLLIVLYFGGRLVRSGEMTIGSLTSFALYSSMVGLGFSGLSRVWSDIVKGSVSAERILCILEESNINKSTSGLMLETVTGSITFEDVSFAYPSRPDDVIINNVSFSIEPGTITALAGSTGVGKSTIGNLLLKLHKPTKGRILLDGHKLEDLDSTWIRKNVFSVVDQEPIMFSGTIMDNIKYGVELASDDDVISAAIKANAHEFILNMSEKYQTMINNNYSNLSVGQKQRIAIARATLKDTRCLILDEATSALDGEAERLVQKALNTVMKGRSVLIMAHRPSCLKLAHKIIVLHNGRIVEDGTYKFLMSKENGHLRKLIDGYDSSNTNLANV